MSIADAKRSQAWLRFVLQDKTERLNTISAFLGAIAAIFGVVCLVSLAISQGDLWKIISSCVYGLTLILVYVSSTLYHGSTGRRKIIFSKLDHLSIYLLIAGTYTPFTLVTLRDSVGWQLFAVIWGMAFVGILMDLIPKQGNRLVPVIIYLLMGWLMVLVLNPLLQMLPISGFYLLLLGGLFYSVGVVFYLLDEKVRYFHEIWHVFVMSGSFSHYAAVFYYVV